MTQTIPAIIDADPKFGSEAFPEEAAYLSRLQAHTLNVLGRGWGGTTWKPTSGRILPPPREEES